MNRIPRLPQRTRRIAALAALFLVSVLITLLVLLAGGRRWESAQQEAAVRSEQARTGPDAEPQIGQILEDFRTGAGEAGALGPGQRSPGRGSEAPGLQDLFLAGPIDPRAVEPYTFRPRLDRWSQEQVARFWIPLKEVALDIIRKENDRNLKELFEEIP